MKRTYKVGLYLRLSKEDGDKEESNSIESQRNILMRFLNDSDDMEYIDEYVDDGYTGTNFNRPGFQKMFADLERGIIDCIIVKDLSRFGRNYLDVGRYVQQIFPRMNIRFIAINDNVDTKNEYENGFDMMLPIKNVFNESYSRDISRKVQSSFKAMQYAGLFTGAYCSYGYVKNPADKHKLVIDPYAAVVVKKIFNWYISGMGQRGIAAKLNEEKIVCPAEYKRQNGEKYRNSKQLPTTTYWTYSTVHRVLKNGMYKGCMVQNKSVRRMREKAKARSETEWIVVEGTHEAIIDPETFDRVQELLKQRMKSMDFETNPSIFVGFLKCGDCGRAMVKRSYMQKNGKRRCFYTCGAYVRSGSPICSNHNINHEVLEKVILDDLNKVISKISDLKDLVEKNERMSKQQNLPLGKRELERIVAQLEKVLRLKREAYADYKENLISKEEYIALREEYLQQEDSLSRRKEVLQQQEKEDQNTLLESKWVTELLEHKGLTKLDRDTVVQFLDEVLVYETDKKGNQRIKIKYRFSEDMDFLFQTIYEEK